MEAIGERPEQFGGNVVVLGRAGVAAGPAPEGFSGSGFSDSGFTDSGSCIPGSPAAPEADDGTRLGPGRLLRAVPAGLVPAESAPAVFGPAVLGPADAAPTESGLEDSAPTESGPAESELEDSAPTESGLVDSVPEGSVPLQATAPDKVPAAVAGPLDPASLPAGTVAHTRREPLSLAEIGRLLAEAAAAAPTILAGADYVEAATYAGEVEELSRGVEYLQVLSAGTVDRTRTQAVAAADAARASRSRTGKTWVTGWDNGVETLNETDTNWPGGSTPRDTRPGTGTGTARARTGTGAGGQDRVITSPADDGCANTAEFLRLRLRIGKSEANRRLALAADILPATTLTGDTIPAPREHLAAALTPTPASTGTPHTQDSTGTDTEDTPAATQKTPWAPATKWRAQPPASLRFRPGPGPSSA
jgi:hypothetical protein